MSPNIGYKAFDSTRYFGVELEVDERVDREMMGEVIRGIDPSREVFVTPGWAMTTGGTGPHTVPANSWSVKTDRTCASTPGNYGYEVASPKLSGNESVVLCGKVAEGLSNLKCAANQNCGVHVHADISEWSRDQTGVMLARWLKIEWIIAEALPLHRRRNQYARLMRQKHYVNQDHKWEAAELYSLMEPTNLEVHQNHEKRVAVNLVGYATKLRHPDYGRGTAEFRLPEGTVDRSEVENWTRIYVHFIDECESKSMPDCLKNVSLEEAMEILGLTAKDGVLLLSPELHETKIWFLRRVLKYTTNPTLFKDALAYLNKMVEPLETYVETPPEVQPEAA